MVFVPPQTFGAEVIISLGRLSVRLCVPKVFEHDHLPKLPVGISSNLQLHCMSPKLSLSNMH